MLIGEFSSKISAKKRVAIPKKIREEFSDSELIITRGYEGCLVIVTKEMWENLASDILEGSFINQNIRDISRFLIGSAVELKPDKQGRVVIPDQLHVHSKLQDEAIFVGLVNWVEIWDKTKWNERVAYASENSNQIAQELIKSTTDK